ncbi:TetR/AcrR family transcriptional regulator [Aurantimonas endophytica]|uniref:AcrR family transcriptional regulator n=1 Tax=Aurantimonas endophytica TaxID=1522175 RepID=A0A7W6HG63_9HYPH|nr:TetR/AcrR family transcriptional regulator [Aurantimonas endophytica]MBB4004619.1 AcrR family transcriptional regulator [Aurantimonas endophytica]MCO6405451.1 TetR family transcriptional regulator [Aurantimonas endophytica]
MTRDKTRSTATNVRGEPLRQNVLDAAERLLQEGKANFSMRDLAAEAGVSFATPFNQFGNKAALMHALAARRIETVVKRFAERRLPPLAADRVLLAIDIAIAGILEKPEVNRVVMGWIGTSGPAPGNILAQSKALWAMALGDGDGLPEAYRERTLRFLPGQLAFGFRGVLSFWTAGELPDDALAMQAREVAETLLRGLANPGADCHP